MLLARVNSDESLGVSVPRNRPEQQAVSITAVDGAIGEYRYLLWDVRPTPRETVNVDDNTFYGEFDVYVEER